MDEEFVTVSSPPTSPAVVVETKDEINLAQTDLLLTVQFYERYRKVRSDCETLLSSEKLPIRELNETIGQRNKMKRMLFCAAEEIRLDLEEQLLKYNTKEIPPKVQHAFLQLDQLLQDYLHLDVLQMDPQFQPILVQKILMTARFVGFLLVTVLLSFVYLFLLPLHWMVPILRRKGIPNGKLPMDFAQKIISWGQFWTTGCEVYVEGEKNLRQSSSVFMFTHSSNIDGLMMMMTSPFVFNFMAKKTLFLIPFIGWIGRWGFDYVAVDRSNRKKGIESLRRLGEIMNTFDRSIAISPEGTRTKSGQLQNFKKGPFYLQEDVKKPISPILILGAYESWSPNQLFCLPSKILVRYLPQFVPDPKLSRDANRLALRRIYLKEMYRNLPDYVGQSSSISTQLKHLVWLAFVFAFSWTFFKSFGSVTSSVAFLLNMSTGSLYMAYGVIVVLIEIFSFLT